MPTNHMGTLLKACGRGSQAACSIAKRVQAIYAGSVISFSEAKIDATHANKMPFKGTLLLLDEPSQKPPHGSQGHRILVHKDVAKNKLSGIIGMAVNYSPGGLDEHATRHKVGVITKAWIEGNKVMVGGFIWSKDFPEAEKQLKGRSDLGMSMELANVYVEDEDASVWTLEDFEFTGATILKKDAAAYTNTSLAARAATREEGENMSKPNEKEKKKVAAAHRDTGQSGDVALAIQAMGGHITTALSNVLGPLVTEIKASNQSLRDDMAELNGRLQIAEVQAAAQEEDEEIVLNAAKEEDDSDEMDAAKEADDSDEDDMAAAKKKEDDDEEDDSSDDDDSSDLDAMEDLGLEEADPEPGEINKDASNRGDKKYITKPPKQGEHLAGNVAKGRIHSVRNNGGKGMNAAAVKIESLYASNRKLKRTIQAMNEEYRTSNRKLRTQIKTMQAQVEHFAEVEGRRSTMPVELTNLAAKAGINLPELKASGQQMSVEAADAMFAAARQQGINIDPKDRIAMKNLLTEQGILANGEVDRGYGRTN